MRLTAAQLDTVVAGASSGGADVSSKVVVSSGANRIGGRLGLRSRSSLRSSSSSGYITAWGYGKGPDAQAFAQTDGTAPGNFMTTKQTISLRGQVPGFAWAASATAVSGVSITPPSGF